MDRNHTMLFRYDDATRQALEAIKERDGMPFHEQLRRAVALWIVAKTDRNAGLSVRAGRLSHDLTEAYVAHRNKPLDDAAGEND